MATRQQIMMATVMALGLLLPLASLRPVSGSQKSPVVPPPTMTAQKPFVVVVDAGHGGQDTGVVASDGTREKDINLAIALKLKESLTKDGVRVVMTRADDTFLPIMARPALVGPNHANYFVSIHCDNAGPADVHSGPKGYYHGSDLAEQWLASILLDRVSKATNISHYSVLSDTTRFTAGFGVLRGSTVPAVMVECGSLNNARDLMSLRQEGTQQKIADGIAAGLVDFDEQYSPVSLQKKRIFVAAVYAHNTRIVQFWNAVAENSGIYALAVRRHQPELFTAVLATTYVFNGHLMTREQARKQLQDLIDRYGSRHFVPKSLKVTANPADTLPNQMVLLSTEHWGPDKSGAGVTLSRRDVWTKTPAGWRLLASDVK